MTPRKQEPDPDPDLDIVLRWVRDHVGELHLNTDPSEPGTLHRRTVRVRADRLRRSKEYLLRFFVEAEVASMTLYPGGDWKVGEVDDDALVLVRGGETIRLSA